MSTGAIKVSQSLESNKTIEINSENGDQYDIQIGDEFGDLLSPNIRTKAHFTKGTDTESEGDDSFEIGSARPLNALEKSRKRQLTQF